MSNGEHCKDHPFYCDAAPAAVSQEQMQAYAHAHGIDVLGITTGRVSGTIPQQGNRPQSHKYAAPDAITKDGMMIDLKLAAMDLSAIEERVVAHYLSDNPSIDRTRWDQSIKQAFIENNSYFTKHNPPTPKE